MFSVWYQIFKIVLNFEEADHLFFTVLMHTHKINICDSKCVWLMLFTKIMLMEVFNWLSLHTWIKDARGKRLVPVTSCTEDFNPFHC